MLSKFRNTRISEELLQEFWDETIAQAIEKKLIKSTAIIVDSTHSKSKHALKTPTQILRKMTKELRKEIYKTQHKSSKNFPEKPDLKGNYGLGRTRSTGLFSMKVQFFLTAFTANAVKITKLAKEMWGIIPTFFLFYPTVKLHLSS